MNRSMNGRMTLHRTPSEAAPSRMQPLSRLPVFYSLQGKRVVIAGGSAAAAWKAELLHAAGARLEICAPALSDDMRDLLLRVDTATITLHERAWQPDDLAGATMVIGAFDQGEDAERFAAAAREQGVPVNVIDKPAYCDFSFGSIVNRSPLVVAVSTDGAAPVFAQAIRAKIEAMLPTSFAAWTQAAKDWRATLQNSGLTFNARRRFWQLFTAHALQRPTQPPTFDDFTKLMDSVRGEGATPDAGSVTLVGAGPGDPELLTLRAVRALQSADVILFDDLVSPEILDFARREAKHLLVGKSGHGPSCKQGDINALLVGLAKSGKRVVRLKGGDPMIFGRAGEEIDACRAADIAVEVVPGITAAQGASARLQVSMTQRETARRVQYVTGTGRNGELPDDLDWNALADPQATTVIYMGRRTCRTFFQRAIAAGLDPKTPAAAVQSATRPGEKIVWGQAESFAADFEFDREDGPTVILVGEALSQNQIRDACRSQGRGMDLSKVESVVL